jgi:hypothetical protein
LPHDGGSAFDGAGSDVADSWSSVETGATDAGPDNQADVFVQVDANDATLAKDVVAPDGSDADAAAMGDACCGGDVALDARDAGDLVLDAAHDGQDATVDAHEGDGGMEAGDSTVVDVGSDADSAVEDADASLNVDAGDADSDAAYVYVCPAAQQTYQIQYAQAFCYGVGNCCTAYDAGGFNLAQCVDERQVTGWDDTIPSNRAVICRGNVIFDPDAGARCIAALESYPCGTSVDALTFGGIIRGCEGVLSGTIPDDAGQCIDSYECATGYCQVATGVCRPLVQDGGACTSDDMCRSASTGQPPLFCNVNFVDSGIGTCVPQQANGLNCGDNSGNWDDQACAVLQCGDDQTCGTVSTLDFCQAYPGDSGTD